MAVQIGYVGCENSGLALLVLTIISSGQVFPIHPLDVSPRITADANSKCIGSFVPQSLGPDWDLYVPFTTPNFPIAT